MTTSVLDKVEQLTHLAGHNRMAVLTFRLGGPQLFGINVFKVREVMQRPTLEHMPSMHALLAGSFDYRGHTIPVVDLADAMAFTPLASEPAASVIVTEFCASMQAFLVRDVNGIVHCSGADLHAPTSELGLGPCVNAITRTDGELLSIVDVEQVLSTITGQQPAVSRRFRHDAGQNASTPRRVLVVDDSSVARAQIGATLEQLQIEFTLAKDGAEALDLLNASANDSDPVDLVISDIEMPTLDGYALVRAIRADPQWRHLKVLLHSSLSGVYNESMVAGVGADRFVAKFQPDALAAAVLELLPHASV